MKGRHLAVALLGVSSLALVGCGTLRPGVTATVARDAGATGSPTPRTPWVAPSYPPIPAADACPRSEPEHLPSQLGPVHGVYLCTEEERSIPGEGRWMFRLVRGVTGGVDRLLAAYSPPDTEPGDGPCAVEGMGPLVVFLQTDRLHAVRAPLGVCGHPTEEAQAAFLALTSDQISATRTGQTQSQLSIETQCADGWKDMLAMDEGFHPSSKPPPHPQSIPSGSRACLYIVRNDEEGDRIGHLSAGHLLSADQLETINNALANATPDPSCSRHEHSRFALLWDGKGALTYVALDGCAVMQDGVGWWRAEGDLRAAVS